MLKRLLACLFVVATLSQAQFRAGLQGTVTDPSGAVVPNARVVLRSVETGREVDTRSTGEGFYRFSGLGPGTYTITVEATGFKPLTVETVAISAEEVKGLNLTLETGVQTESVTVTADVVPPLRTEEANISRALTRQEIESLPQINRDPYELLRLTPGVFGTGARGAGGGAVNLPNTTGPGGSNLSIFQTENQVPISANGQRVSSNNYMVDGVSVNSLNWGGAAIVTPNQESVKQISVKSNAYSAEYGRNTGAQIEVVSQNGTDQLHGSAVFKYNSPGLNAYNRFGGINAPPVRVENRFRQWAGSLGGPVIPGKGLFFFFSYEGIRNRTNTPFTSWIETPEFRRAVVSARPNSVTARVLGQSGIEPRIVNVLNAPCPSGFGANCRVVNGGLDIGSLTGAAGQYVDIGQNPAGAGLDGVPDVQFAQLANPNEQMGHQFNARIDYSRGSDAFAVSTYITTRDDLAADPSGRSRPLADIKNKPLNSSYTATWNRTLTPTILNEARANFTRFAANQVTAAESTNWGVPRIEIEALPFDRIRFGPPWAETTPAIFAQNTFEVRDYVRMVRSTHALTFGAEVRWEQDNSNLAGGARPLYTFQGLFNFANDAPIYYQVNADPRTGAPGDAQRYFRNTIYGFFVQDDWKVKPNFTLNLGLRYELYSPLTEKQDRIANIFIPGPANLQAATVRPVERLYEWDRNNFAPRIGLAYSPQTFADRIVVRGGFGIYYNRIPNALFSNSRGNPPYFARYSICCGTAGSPLAGGQIAYTLGTSNSPTSFPINPALAVGIDPATGAPRDRSVEIWGAFGDTPNPYAYIWSADIQYRLAWDVVATVGYQGSAGHKFIRIVNQNFLYRNNPKFFAVYIPQPDVNQNYNALLLTARKQYSRGLQFHANYRWSKSIDTLSFEGPGAVTNQTYPQDLRSERGPSDYDVTHYFNASVVYDLPWLRSGNGMLRTLLGGFQVGWIVTANSGFPWTPKTGQAVTTPGGPTLAPTRPIGYLGGAGNDQSDDAFLTGSNFPGGGRRFFDVSRPGPPGIGRNSFRGPRFFSNDVSVMKEFRFGRVRGLGEAANLELRMNLYNAFNQLNLQPLGFFDPGTFVEDPFFGRSSAGLAGRVVELQARFSF